MKKKSGFTFIELLIFIIIMGVIASLLATLFMTMLRRSATINSQNDASMAAVRCMDWFVGQRFINGFNNVNSSTNTSFCNSVPTGYNIATNVSNTTLYNNATSYRTITVTVTGTATDTSSSKAVLSTIIANY